MDKTEDLIQGALKTLHAEGILQHGGLVQKTKGPRPFAEASEIIKSLPEASLAAVSPDKAREIYGAWRKQKTRSGRTWQGAQLHLASGLLNR